ncbi:Os01g0281050 [Oryza sativa Japonica Group]|uniref:Os01g0281050 protein n=1 Tax=Oryza sativa subsp. japonica TaxID=39947 RepID=A0A0P0V1V1_ORYSJ|nr:hypothetical protein EE612_001833 [Oryza sativa]BAS71596.1 Os01g0281050 [Oryza sativa Japonica Group]
MWRSQRWSPRQRSRMERQTPAMFRSSEGGSLARMHSMASSGRSSTDGSPPASSPPPPPPPPPPSSTAAARFLLKDGISGMVVSAAAPAPTPPSSRSPARNPSSARASSWHSVDRNNLISRAHGFDKNTRQAKTKVATKASIDQTPPPPPPRWRSSSSDWALLLINKQRTNQ